MNSVMINQPYELFENGTWFSHKTNKWLKPMPNSKGYERIAICNKGKRKFVFTHIKVVEHFGDCKGNHIPKNNGRLFDLGLSIDHLDMNKQNNTRENLELVSHSENLKRMWKNKHAQLDDDLPY